MLSQCGSLSSKGISTLVSKCRQLKMLDVAMTKVILIHNSRKIVAQAATSSHAFQLGVSATFLTPIFHLLMAITNKHRSVQASFSSLQSDF